MERTRFALAVPLLFLAAGVSIPSIAQLTPVGFEERANAATAGSQAAPSAAVGPSGRHALAWQGPGDGTDVWVQVWDGDGTILVPEQLANGHQPGCQQAPDVSFAPDGGFVVVWQSEGQDGDGWGIFAQSFDDDGSLAGPEIQVNSTTAGDQRAPVVAHDHRDDHQGKFTIAWESSGQDGDGWGVYARRFDASGPLTGEVQVAVSGAGDQRRPALAIQPSRHAVFAWEGPDGSGPGIFLRRFDDDLTSPGNEVRANVDTAGFQSGASLACDASGNVIVAWEGSGRDGSASGIGARRLDRSLIPIPDREAEIDVNATSAGLQSRPVVASSGSGDFVVAWESWGQDEGGPGVFAREFNFMEQPRGPEVRVNSFVPGPQRRPALAASSSGEILAAWESMGQDGDGAGVFTQRYLLPGLDFYTLVPCRLFDTRTIGGTNPPLESGGTGRQFLISDKCGIPLTARAISVNLTVLDATGNGNVALFPADVEAPLVSNINFAPGLTRANNAIVALARNGSGEIKARAFVNALNGTVHLILDVNGYFE